MGNGMNHSSARFLKSRHHNIESTNYSRRLEPDQVVQFYPPLIYVHMQVHLIDTGCELKEGDLLLDEKLSRCCRLVSTITER